MTTVEVLRKARALYEANPSHAAYPDFPRGDTVCLVTACDRASARSAGAGRAHDALREAIGARVLSDWNAEHTTEEVLAAFDRAIEAGAA